MDLLFSGVTIVTMDEAMHVHFGAYLGVTGTKISYISKDPPPQAPKKIMDASGMVLMPGLINCHTHLAMSLLRGCAEDCGLSRWLSDCVLPREDRLDARSARAGVMLSLGGVPPVWRYLGVGSLRVPGGNRPGCGGGGAEGEHCSVHDPVYGRNRGL